jgi:hypothetical protein
MSSAGKSLIKQHLYAKRERTNGGAIEGNR